MRQQIRGSPLCRLIHVHKCVWNGRLSRQCLLQWFGHFAFSSIVCVSTNQRSSKKSLVIDGSHAISVASFASGDARIARGPLKCMITAHPSFTRVFSNNTQTTKKSTQLPIVMLLFNTKHTQTDEVRARIVATMSRFIEYELITCPHLLKTWCFWKEVKNQ